MIELTLETIQMSLISPHRVVVLRETNGKRYLPIWIGPCEAEAIAVRLKGLAVQRPLTHDLLVDVIEVLQTRLLYVIINKLSNNTFYAQLIIDNYEQQLEVDCRPSDALAVAVRAGVSIFVTAEVLDDAGIEPEPDLTDTDTVTDLGVFRDFLSTLQIDDPSPDN